MNRGPFFCHCGDHAWAILTRGFVTLVSPTDAPLLEERWYAFVNQAGNVYAGRSFPRGQMRQRGYLHRMISGDPEGLEVDHKNLNGLDNRRENLREATKSENAANRRKHSGQFRFKGVRQIKGRALKKPWLASIHKAGQYKHIGYFETELEAAEAYLKTARELYGDFARVA